MINMNINNTEYWHTDMFNVNNFLEISYVLSGCGVTANSPNDSTVNIASGEIMLNDEQVTVSSQNITITAASSGKYKYALVRINSSGVASVVYGTESSNDDINNLLNIPDYDPDNYVLLARIKRSDVTNITNSDIKDMRQIHSVPTIKALKLVNQTIDAGVSIGDSVYSDSGTWKKANGVDAIGVYEGNNTIVLKGICSLSGLDKYRFYFKQSDGTISGVQTNDLIGYSISDTELIVDIDKQGS